MQIKIEIKAVLIMIIIKNIFLNMEIVQINNVIINKEF